MRWMDWGKQKAGCRRQKAVKIVAMAIKATAYIDAGAWRAAPLSFAMMLGSDEANFQFAINV